jgi:hypothetical protein
MKGITFAVIGCMLVSTAGTVWAEEKAMKELPKDVLDAGTVWTEPIEAIDEEVRHTDPVRGFWTGLWTGTAKTFKRTFGMVEQPDDERPDNAPPASDEKPLLKYSF